MEPHEQTLWYHSKRPFGANIPHQRTNSSTGKPVVLLVPGWNLLQEARVSHVPSI
jgi:hypothetical protein